MQALVEVKPVQVMIHIIITVEVVNTTTVKCCVQLVYAVPLRVEILVYPSPSSAK